MVKDTEKLINEAKGIIGSEGSRPMEILDQEAYNEYLRLGKNPLLNEKKMYTCSDDRIVNLGKLAHQLQNDIQGLPVEEQKKIMGLKDVYYKLLNKKQGAFRKAYGTNVQRREDGAATTGIGSVLDAKRLELIELFGRMFTMEEVHEVVVSVFKLKVQKQALVDWRQRNIDAINVRIEQFKKEYSDIRLAHKRGRLEELLYLYNDRKRIYERTKKGEDYRLLLTTIDQIKKEVEGEVININGSITVEMESVINEQMKELFSHINIKEIIVARVASKLGLDVSKITAAISRGYYFKNLHTEEGQYEELPSYPSTETYDFDRIGRQKSQEQHLQQTNNVPQKVELLPQQKEQALSIKEILLRKIKEKQESVNYTKNTLNPTFIDRANRGD